MKFLHLIVLYALLIFTFIPYSSAQGQKLYSISDRVELRSSELKKSDPVAMLDQAKVLARQNPDSALLIAGKALKIAQLRELPLVEAAAFRRVGLILYTKDELTSALHYLHRSEEMYLPLSSSKELRMLYNNLGATYDLLDNKNKAIEYYFKSLELAEIEGNVPKQIANLYNLGELSIQRKQYKTAIEYLSKAISLSENSPEQELLPETQLKLAGAYIYQRDFDQAKTFLDQAFKYFEQEQEVPEYQILLADCYNAYGVLAEEQNDFSLAKKQYLRALDTYQDLEIVAVKDVYINIGTLLLKEKKFQSAIGYFEKALELVTEQSDVYLEKELYWNLSLAHLKLNELQEAYELQNSFAFLSDSLYSSALQETTNRSELLYQQARAERKEEANQRLIDRQKTFSNYLMGALGIAGLIALVCYLLMRNYAHIKEKLANELRHKEESNKLLLVEMLKDHEVETLNAMLDGQEMERKRIARDLHDSMGGTLAAIQLTLASLERKIPDMTEIARSTYEKTETLLDQAYQQMRGISHNLVDLNLKEGGLSPALAQLQETLSQNTEIDINMNYESLGERRLDSNVEQHSYRITQELFQNIIKHADASMIEYELNYSPLTLHISIKDDGKGFEYDPGSKVSGIGLNNILTRVRQLEGNMDIQTEPGKGTRIAVDIPLVLS